MVPSGRRIFVMGSGFSASMGLPTLVGLFRQVTALPERAGESGKEHILSALEHLYPHFNQRTTPPSYPPFEEFLSMMTVTKDLPFFDEDYWDIKWRSSLRLLTDCMAAKSRDAESSELLQDFVKDLRNGDVIIITFNWDNLIERALLMQSKKVNLLSRDSTAVTVLKLHGSLNWAYIPQGTSLKHPESVLHLSERVVCTIAWPVS